ncbi:App1 family protein [Modestobacter lapidis]
MAQRQTGGHHLRRASSQWQAAPVRSLSGLARRGDSALREVLSRAARRRGWTPAVLAYPGYGSGGRIRVLGRVLLAPPGASPQDRRALPGWQRFLTLEAPHAEVTVEVAGVVRTVRSDADGLVDVTLEVPAGLLGDRGQVPAVLSAGSRSATAPVHLSSPGAARGIVCDIDDTVLVTGIATPLRAAWRTFVQPMATRRAVPGMAALLRQLTAGAPHVPVVYLSNGPWNLAGPLAGFLERAGFPAGALLLTDWGPRPTRWFRDGRAHKRSALHRLADDLPGVGWTLVGDTSEHDPALYRAFVAARPDRVRAVLLRDVQSPIGSEHRSERQRARSGATAEATGVPASPTGSEHRSERQRARSGATAEATGVPAPDGAARVERVGAVPVVYAPDGASLAAALAELD